MPKNCKYEDGKNYANVMGFRPDSGKSGQSKCGDKKGCKSDLDPFKPYLSGVLHLISYCWNWINEFLNKLIYEA